MKKKRRNQILMAVIAGFLVLILLLSLILSMIGNVSAVSQSEIDALKKEEKALAAKKDDIKDTIQSLAGDKKKVLAQKAALDQENAVIEQEIRNLSDQITAYEQMIVEKGLELDDTLAQEESQYQLFRTRVRAMEEMGTVSYLEILFKASSFSDLLERASFIGEIMDYDQGVMTALELTRQQIAATKEELEATQSELKDAKVMLDSRKVELDQKISAAWQLIGQINAQSEEYADALDEMEAEADRVAKEIDRLIAKLEAEQKAKGGNTIVGEAGYIWPLPGYTYISSYFTPRYHPVTGVWHSHTGIDIPAPKNTPIKAARSGTVLISAYGSSYGNYVVLSHGNNESTLYAHMNSRAVAVGDTVTQGQVIGYVGTTGSSTGYHLHFEVRINGNRTDPLAYYSIS